MNGYLAERNAASLSEGITRIMRGDLKTTPAALHALVGRDWSWDLAAERIKDQLYLAASKPRPGADTDRTDVSSGSDRAGPPRASAVPREGETQ